ncbi:MAG TPA: histidine kinase dimerization/phospho-acceptor domain-containing protein, partial [Pseudonocardia sp.]
MSATHPGPADGGDTTPVARTGVRRSLAWRVAAACLAVALVAVLAAAAVGLRLVSETARQVTAAVLAQEADIVAAQLDDPALIGNPGPQRQAAASRKLVQTLQAQGVDIVLLGKARTGTGPVATALTAANADQALAGVPVSTSVDVAGRTYVVEARPAASSAFALVRRSDTGPAGNGLIRRNVGFALLAGAAVALLVGLVVGTLMARPLRRTAAAAHLLRTGRRDVRVPVQGPAEVAEVAAAVNDLADALARSEARQREFLLSVSHELRTPLTAVRGFAESLADGVVTGRDVIPTGATIVAEATRLDRLVGDLMELARLEADDFRLDLMPVDLGALAREAAAVWHARCRAA